MLGCASNILKWDIKSFGTTQKIFDVEMELEKLFKKIRDA